MPPSTRQTTLVAQFREALAHEKQTDLTTTHELLTSLAPKRLATLGLAVLNLTVTNLKTGMGGKQLVELGNDPAFTTLDLIETRGLRVGDIVRVEPLGNASGTKAAAKKSQGSSKATSTAVEELTNTRGVEGVVLKISLNALTVAVEGDEDRQAERALLLLDCRLWLVKITNSATYKRMEVILNKFGDLHCSPLFQVLVGDAPFVPPSAERVCQARAREWFNPLLNESQRDAIAFAMCSPLTLIHGPPGTGKTHTVIELIQQLVLHEGQRVLVCGPSNIAVDTILERLSATKQIRANRLIRIGHPGRLLPENYQHSLDVLIKSPASDEGAILNDIRGDINQSVRELSRAKKSKSKREIFAELKRLRHELRAKEKRYVDALLAEASVVASTLHGSGARELLNLYDKELGMVNGKPFFDTLIIDEVSQALEPQCWIPLLNHLGIKQVVFAGDNKQLPPTVKTQDSPRLQSILTQTIFDRLVAMYPTEQVVPFKRFLGVQYRMNEAIMAFSNQQLYHGELKADASVRSHTLQGLVTSPLESNLEDLGVPFVWYDTQGGDHPERSEEDSSATMGGGALGASKYNELEAAVVVRHVEGLVEMGVSPGQIGVVSPYNAQVALLKSLLVERFPGIELSSVDGFQGREKEVIVLSLVRSNDEHQVGFLKDERRLNVAMTRARRQLCIVGDMECLALSRNRFLSELVAHAEEHAEVRYP